MKARDYHKAASAAGFELSEAKRKKRNSIIILIIYTILLGCGYYLWTNSKLSFWGFWEYLPSVGILMIGIIIIVPALTLFAYFQAKQLEWANYRTSLLSDIGSFILSYICVALIFCLPSMILWLVIEEIPPIYNWLIFRVDSPLVYRGVRVLGFISVFAPYIIFSIRYIKAKKQIPYYEGLQNNFTAVYYELDREETEASKRKSWEKTKSQYHGNKNKLP